MSPTPITALRIALIYVAAALAWTFFAHGVVQVHQFGDNELVTFFLIWEDMIWIGISAAMLYFLVTRATHQAAATVPAADEAARQLAASERRHLELFEASPLPMWIYDTQTLDFLAVNDEAIARYGYAREEFMAMTIRDIRPATEVPTLLERIEARRPEDSHSANWTHRLKDGRLIEVDIVSHGFEFMGRPARFVIAYDMTEQRRAEKALRIAAAVFEQSREAILVADADGCIVTVNSAFTAITGYGNDEAIGQTTALLKSGRHDAEFYRQMWSAIGTRGLWRGEIWNRRKNGDIYPEWLSISAVKNADGRIDHYIAIFIELATDGKHKENVAAAQA